MSNPKLLFKLESPRTGGVVVIEERDEYVYFGVIIEGNRTVDIMLCPAGQYEAYANIQECSLLVGEE